MPRSLRRDAVVMGKPRYWFFVLVTFLTVLSGAVLASEAATPAAVEQPSFLMRLWDFFGRFHPATVHMPIGLLTVAALFVAARWKWPAISEDVPFYCLLVGAVATVPATVMGFSIAESQGYPGIWSGEEHEIFWHRWGGVIVMVTSLILAALAIKGRLNKESNLNRIWPVGTLLLAVMVGLVGHDGGGLSYGQDWYSEPWEERKPPQQVKIEPPAEDGKIDFVKHVVPIFQAKCLKCHGTKKKAKGGYKMTTAEDFFAGGDTTKDEGWAIVTRGSRELDETKNQFLYSMRHEDPEFIMPPEKEKNPVTDEEMKILTDWVEQGAVWPEGYVVPEEE